MVGSNPDLLLAWQVSGKEKGRSPCTLTLVALLLGFFSDWDMTGQWWWTGKKERGWEHLRDMHLAHNEVPRWPWLIKMPTRTDDHTIHQSSWSLRNSLDLIRKSVLRPKIYHRVEGKPSRDKIVGSKVLCCPLVDKVVRWNRRPLPMCSDLCKVMVKGWADFQRLQL